jgi:predicted nucleic acid-binding protein
VSDAFDSDVLIYLAHDAPAALSIRHFIEAADTLIGSVVLLPEVLGKPLSGGDTHEHAQLIAILARFDLKPVDAEVADAAVTLSAKYRLRAADAIHLATAVVWGAERFHTNNRKHFGPHIAEVEVVWPSVSR